MRSLRRALLALGAVGFVAGAVPLALALASAGGHQRTLIAVTGPLIGWAFIGTGIFAWLRRPDNRFGALMTAVGFSACLAGLRVSTEPWIFIIGLLFITSQWALLYHMLLAFPGGTLHGRLERLLVAGMYFSAWVVHPVQVVVQDTTRIGLPENPLLIGEGNSDLSSTLSRSRFWFALVLLGALAVILARRWAATSQWERRALGPVLISGGLVMALLGVWYAALLADVDPEVVQALEDARYVVLCTVPFAFLAGLLRSHVAGASAVSEIVARLGDPAIRSSGVCHALADALDGTSLDLAFVDPDGGYVDNGGRAVAIPPEGPGRAFTPLEAGDDPSVVLTYDPSREDERELVRAVSAAATLTLENERLATELRAKVEEVSASRARIVESGDAARRRLERDLHDGAQQRLVSLALNLRVLGSHIDGDPETRRQLDAARLELDQALGELRELARGLHPSVLSDQGLAVALEGLAQRAPLPVDLDARPGERLPERVESASYFVVAEALTNVAKYARATRARVHVSRADGHVLVEVTDDGVGGADPEAGSGLRGLLDRVSALGGTLEVDSEPGGGTTVRAVIPCE
jgi:signal transduction histidine kinase